MNTQAEICSKLPKQYWEEHDIKMTERRQKAIIDKNTQGWKHWKEKVKKKKKNPENYWKEQHCQIILSALMQMLSLLFNTVL